MKPGDEKSAAIKRAKEERSYAAYVSLSNLAGQSNDTGQKSLRIAVLRSVTVEPLLPVLEGEAALLGQTADIYLGDFDAIASDIFDSESTFYGHGSEIIILFQWLADLAPALNDSIMALSADEVEANTSQVVNTLKSQIAAIRERSSAPILINNFPALYRPALGILEAQGDWPHASCHARLNSALTKLVQAASNVFVVDLASIYARIGISEAFAERHWAIARTPFSKNALVAVGREYGRFFRALTGNTRKCLVLDCDGTLWGGIVGEDGIDGIQLSADYPGSSFVAFQREILNLYHRGIILAGCSKNNEDDVMDVFQNHPNMVLKEEHFAALRINWSDKVENILSIAEELNIGVDSMVFIDDTDFECARVREALPEVEVVQLDDQPSSYRRQLSDAGLFDSLVFTDEDLNRTATYKAEKKRKSIQTTARSLEDYLADLEIRAKIALADKEQIPRISQLTQKTNQFNLTTRRYTEADIAAFCGDANTEVLYLWFADKFSEFGIIGAAILKVADGDAVIDNFVLSCRALGRELEKALLASVARLAERHGCTTLLGSYIKSKKNYQVADFYKNSSFQLVQEFDGGADWAYNIADTKTPELATPSWIHIVSPE